MLFPISSIIVLVVGSVVASAASNKTAVNGTESCGVITKQLLEFYGNNSNTAQPFLFKPSLAHDCLQSSAIDNQLAASYVTEIKKYIQFQSTLAYLKNPPVDYYYPAVDILGGLDAIGSKAAAGGYKSQYAFDLALNTLVNSAHDGHFSLDTCTGGTIRFKRGRSPLGFVSVSKDGVALPEIFLYNDMLISKNVGIQSVAKINGQNATAVLQNFALFARSDLDSSYNDLFTNYGFAPVTETFDGSFSVPGVYQYPGDHTNITYSNGTTVSFENFATTSAKAWSSKIVDGNSFFKANCIFDKAATTSNTTSSPTSTASLTPATGTTAPTLLGYPYKPIVKDPSNQIAGYFMNGTGYADTAILRVATFENATADETLAPKTFQNTTRDFFAAARAANKTRIIIDVSGNPGGNTILPNDIFKRLFPGIEPYGGSRLRGNDAANIFGATLAAIPDSSLAITSSDNAALQAAKAQVIVSAWDYRSALTADLQNFTGWTSGQRPYFPSVKNNNDTFLAISRPPVNSSFYDITTDSVIPYGTATPPENPQPFLPQNVVLLTDGICASACSIFAEFLTRQAGTKTIVVGGRPQKGPMQAIGGVKGSQAFVYASLQQSSTTVLDPLLSQFIPQALLPSINSTLPGLIDLPLGDPSPAGLKNYGINLRDTIPLGDTQGIPLQFVFEPADCRIFYTPETVFNPSALWEQAHDIAWKGGKCAWGGISSNISSSSNPRPVSPTTNGAVKMTGGFSMMVVALAVAVLI
ncbi:Peptidase S41 family protein [Lachnellula suecica]|uniref:Peptidase S41 family protein n=1 Tax=Lachnellula suecica TaxID=602035 RepID=A0A8T9CE97_9HELO|nr:Peptidase S41 family protein [Lachnellula suecica]